MSPDDLPENEALLKLVPQMAVGGTCSVIWLQALAEPGISVHLCPAYTTSGLSETILVPVTKSLSQKYVSISFS